MPTDYVTAMRLGILALIGCVVTIFGAVTAGCGGSLYGYARTYQPNGQENELDRNIADATYEDVRRDPAEYRSQVVAWFGVVTAVEPAGEGRTRIALTYRAHQERHLCADETEGSCRVTVSDRPTGSFTVVASLAPSERDGSARIWLGSLLHVYGSPTGEADAEGGPMIEPRYIRHFPHGTYVTTADAGHMRR